MGFIRNILSVINENLIADGAYLRIIKGCIFTVLIFVCALLLGLAFAAVLTYCRTSKKKGIAAIACGISFLFKGTPVYLAMLLWNYSFLGGVHRGGLVAAILTLGIFTGGQLTDLCYRAAKSEEGMRNEAVNRRGRQEFFNALYPYLTEQSLFEIKRLVSLVLQLSTLVGLIGVNDLASVLIANGFKTCAPFFAIGCAILFYLVLQLLIEVLAFVLGKKLLNTEEKDD